MRGPAQEEYVEYVTGRLAALRQLAFLLCGDAHRADDSVQATIEKLYLRWARVSKVEHVDQYVQKMLVRTFLDERRRPWARVAFFAGGPPESHTIHRPGANVDKATHTHRQGRPADILRACDVNRVVVPQRAPHACLRRGEFKAAIAVVSEL